MYMYILDMYIATRLLYKCMYCCHLVYDINPTLCVSVIMQLKASFYCL